MGSHSSWLLCLPPCAGVCRRAPQCDIFSLGATAYEICLGRPLPPNGPEWVALRQGVLAPLPPGGQLPDHLLQLLRRMLHPDPACRPTAGALLEVTPITALRWTGVEGRLALS